MASDSGAESAARGGAPGEMARLWVPYLVRAAVVLGLLLLFARFAASAPGWCVALLWAALSGVSALGSTYRHVIGKISRQVELNPDGHLARWNGGRILWMIGATAVAAVCVASLMLDVPGWSAPEWAATIVAALAFPFVIELVNRVLRGEFRSAFLTARVVRVSIAVAGVLLFAAFLTTRLVQPAATYADATAAFLAAGNPFEGSPSAFLGEVGTLMQLVNGLAAYAASKAADVSSPLYPVIEILLMGTSSFGLAGILGVCVYRLSELRQVFAPLPSVAQVSEARASEASADAPLERRFVITTVACPVALFALFLVADALCARAVQTQEYTAAQGFVRDQVGVAVYVLDGKYYDQKAMEELAQDTRDRWANLSSDAQANIVPLVNASFDQREANVDSYLDWYYTLPADYARLANLITGSIEDYVDEQFTEKIESGVDDSELEGLYDDYVAQAAQIDSDYQDGLARCELDGLPDYLRVSSNPMDAETLEDPAKPAQEAVKAAEHAGIGAAAGVATGAIAGNAADKVAGQAAKEGAEQAAEKAAGEASGEATEKVADKAAKKLVTKAAEKKLFAKVVEQIGKTLGTRAAGAAVGGAAGSVVPGLGTVIGIAAGTAAGFGVDYGLLKLDEAQSRDDYRQQIVDTIEEVRAEWLAPLQSDAGEDGGDAQ